MKRDKIYTNSDHLVDYVWEKHYPDGEHVLIITVDDHWDYGVLKNYDNYITLRRKGVHTPYRHTEIMLICHDGFPMRWVKSSRDGHATETGAVSDYLQEALPKMAKEFDKKLNASMRFGDPYEIVDVSAGFIGPDDVFMQHKNGSVGILYYTKPIFDLEILGKQVCI